LQGRPVDTNREGLLGTEKSTRGEIKKIAVGTAADRELRHQEKSHTWVERKENGRTSAAVLFVLYKHYCRRALILAKVEKDPGIRPSGAHF